MAPKDTRVLLIKYHEAAGDAWVKANEHCKSAPHFKYVAERSALRDYQIKEKYALALVRCGKWAQAEHEVQVALSANRGTKSTLLAAMYELKKHATGANAAALEKLIDKAGKW